MKQELIQSFVVWCKETAAKLELDLLTVDDGIVESAWCEETNKPVDVIRPAMNIRAEFRRRLKEIDPLMLHSRELFWPTDLVALAFGPSTRERLRKAAALVGRLASEVTRQQGEKSKPKRTANRTVKKNPCPILLTCAISAASCKRGCRPARRRSRLPANSREKTTTRPSRCCGKPAAFGIFGGRPQKRTASGQSFCDCP